MTKPKTKKKPERKADTKVKGKGKGSNPNSKANLKPPFDGSTPGPGRPKGKLNFDTRVDMAIEVLAQAIVAKHNADPKNKNKQMKLEDIDIEGDIFAQMLNKARSGNEKMIDSFLDRRHGKATARIELTGKGGNPIEIEEKKREAKTKAQKMLGLWGLGSK